ncbi:MAG TPA: hypothetical protein VD929_09515 [Caulobacteraceae bacterium]|nr:hypothetical protein [Caulobacteraceae bacterium]
MSDEALVVIPLPTEEGKITYAVGRLVSEGEQPFAEAIVAIPGTAFAPPRRITLSRYGLARVRPGSLGRPDLYVYEGMILPPPAG